MFISLEFTLLMSNSSTWSQKQKEKTHLSICHVLYTYTPVCYLISHHTKQKRDDFMGILNIKWIQQLSTN